MLDSFLPKDISSALDKIPYSSLCELRLRINSSVIVSILGENYYLASDGITNNQKDGIIVSLGVLQSILNKISNNSMYTINDQLLEGYVTIDGGIRLGVCGELVIIDGKLKTLKNISSINFRFPHLIKNCSLNIYPYIFCNGRPKNTLIVSPPGAGKTTYIRDIIYQLKHREKNLLNILVIDERCEITKVFDGDSVSNFEGLDIYSNCSKKFGFENGIRSMRPDVIITDEINIDRDMEIIENALTSGVKVIASLHSSTIDDLKNKRAFKNMLDKKLFDRFVFLSNCNGIGTLEGVFDENLNLIGV